MRRGPFHQGELNIDDLEARLDQAQAQLNLTGEEQRPDESAQDKKKASLPRT
jgi:hypothetical protein